MRRKNPSISEGSMADIAFLLLIFFMIATQIETEKGILTRLPPYDPDPIVAPLPDNRVLNILVNDKNELLVEKERKELSELSAFIQYFISNPDRRNDFPDKPKDAVISLHHDRSTSYDQYIQVYDAIKKAYRLLREDYAQRTYQIAYHDNIPFTIKKEIHSAIPLVISEAEYE